MIKVTVRDGDCVLQMEGVAVITIVLPGETPTEIDEGDFPKLDLPIISIRCKHSNEMAVILGSLIGAIADIAPESLELAMHTAMHTDIRKAYVRDDG